MAIIARMSAKKDKNKDLGKPVAVNKKAYHNFELIEQFEAGIVLLGTEVKSLRNSSADLNGSYARLIDDECFLVGATIAPYEQAGDNNHVPARNRKLLLHKRQLFKIRNKLDQRGFTLVPLKIYFNSRGLAKIALALATGKRQYDKRKALADRQQKKDIDRQMKKYKNR